MARIEDHEAKRILRVPLSGHVGPMGCNDALVEIEITTDPAYSDNDTEDDEWIDMRADRGEHCRCRMGLRTDEAEALGRALIHAAQIRRKAVRRGERHERRRLALMKPAAPSADAGGEG